MAGETAEPKMFHIVRNGDETGVSGTGRVLDGVVWPNGWVNIFWRTDLDIIRRGDSSINFYESFGAFERIHITSHPSNDTQIIWDDEVADKIAEELEKTKASLANSRKKVRELKAELTAPEGEPESAEESK